VAAMDLEDIRHGSRWIRSRPRHLPAGRSTSARRIPNMSANDADIAARVRCHNTPVWIGRPAREQWRRSADRRHQPDGSRSASPVTGSTTVATWLVKNTSTLASGTDGLMLVVTWA